MQEGRTPIPYRQINRELLVSILRSPKWFAITVTILGLIVLGGFSAAGLLVNKGFGVTGLNRPVMWGFFITNFVFWIGISHAGVMLSAILRLSKAEWRRPATRAAEILTVFSLMTAMMMPLIHTGRPWRTIYWIYTIPFMPYDYARGIWPNVRSPLVWDPSAVYTYLTSSILFVLVALIPDFAVLRDRTTGMSHRIYTILAMGWRGNPRQWKLQIIAGVLLSALILPVFVSVHSIVSWDFGMAVSVKTWHSTIFAPYFVVGAVHSGVSAVAFVMIILRYIYGWQNYIRHEHIDALGPSPDRGGDGLVLLLRNGDSLRLLRKGGRRVGGARSPVHAEPLEHLDDGLRVHHLLPAGGPVVAARLPTEPVDNVHRLHLGEYRYVAGALYHHRARSAEQAGVHLQLVDHIQSQRGGVDHHRSHLRPGFHADAGHRQGGAPDTALRH